MLGEPEARVAPALGMLGKVAGVEKRLARGGALHDRREIEDGKFHRLNLGVAAPPRASDTGRRLAQPASSAPAASVTSHWRRVRGSGTV